MKLIIIFSLLFTILLAKDRPKIALVLSGGGARGAAHVGVLKILEKNHIPIDMIVGTSMGSFMGALYASGKSPQEIENLLIKTKWKNFITADFNRQDIPMRRKNVDYTYQGRLGLGINADNELVLPTGVLKREPFLLELMSMTANTQEIKDFDKLPIPYRAVATDISNGDAVVLKSGSLAEAIYASSAIPGGFQPINIDGIDLVDGGVSSNLPIQVARDMGADIIIAVDVSEDFSKDLDVNSYFIVMGQLIDILTRKNVEASIATLTKKDILLIPNVSKFTALDADKYKEIIQKGVDIAIQNEKKLQKLSLSAQKYKKYQILHRHKYNYNYTQPIIDEIKIINTTYISDEYIRNKIHQKIGSKLDAKLLRENLTHLYHMTIFDSVDYRVKKLDGKNILVIKTLPSWDNHGEIRFAIGLEDDFTGHSAYSLKAGYTMFGLNELGGEWKSDFEIGRNQKAYTEFFQPLDTMQRYYIKPSLVYESVTDIFTTNAKGNQEIFSSRKGGTFAFGSHIGTDYEFEVGSSIFEDKIQVDAIETLSNTYHTMPIYFQVKVDNLDNVNFPKVGVKSRLRWTKEMNAWGSDYNYEQIYFDIEKPINFYSNNITMFVKYGNTYKKNDDMTRLSGTFRLGGLFNLSGYAPYSFIGDNVALGVLKYTYELKDGGFFGTLNAPLYAGFSLETGQTWMSGENINFDTFHKSATLYIAADTFLGPFYFAYGFSENAKQSAYLYLGEKF
ncbi:patatin-like phospholipase family protein [Sulfurimonas sp.]